jgi:glycosyltransferase involved in cell wall biosynthesis
MKLSFVIPAYNEEKYIGKCLDSIFRELAHSLHDAEIVVVNNASTDKTEEVAKRFKDVRVVLEPAKGLTRARRAGFLAASGDLIANVDADTMLTTGWIDKVFREFEKNKNLVALSGPFIYYDLPRSINFLVRGIFYPLGYIVYIIDRFLFGHGALLQGGNFIVRREALLKIGGYNTDIDFYGEDADIARRISKIGTVKFTFDLPIYSSGRRLAGEGVLTMGIRYGLNYFWIIFFKRPYTATSVAVRPEGDSGKLSYKPVDWTKEWTIASLLLTGLFILLALAALLVYILIREGIISAASIAKVKAQMNQVSSGISATSDKIRSEIINSLAK